MDTLVEFPLLNYASKFWPSHLRAIKGREKPSINEVVANFMLSATSWNAWVDVLSRTPDFILIAQRFGCFVYRRDPTPLCSAIYLGLPRIAQKIIEAGADVNATKGNLGSALQLASTEGYVDIVESLLAAGADPNVQAGIYRTAL